MPFVGAIFDIINWSIALFSLLCIPNLFIIQTWAYICCKQCSAYTICHYCWSSWMNREWNLKTQLWALPNNNVINNNAWRGKTVEKKLNVPRTLFNMAYLRGQNDERDTNHDDHIELRWPDVRHKISIADRWKCDNYIICALKQIQMTMAGSLKMLNTANTAPDRIWKWNAKKTNRKIKHLDMSTISFNRI